MGWGRLYLLNVLYLLYLLSILYSSAGTHFSSIKTEFFFRSKASRMASPTPSPLREKSAWVWSGFRPHRVMSCGLPIAASTMQFAPCSPRLFRSRLRARRVPQHSVRGLNTASEGTNAFARKQNDSSSLAVAEGDATSTPKPHNVRAHGQHLTQLLDVSTSP